MRSKAIKSLCVLLTLTFLIGSIPVFNVAGQARPKIYIDPAENTFFTDATDVGDTFTVSIMAADWAAPGIFSHQIAFKYDNTMLEAVDAEIPDPHWLTPSIKPGNIFVVDSGTIDHAAGLVTFSVTLLSPEEGKIGGGTIAKITLKITAAPPSGQSLTSELGFDEVIMVDPDASAIPPANYDVVPGTFTYATPPPPWYLKIEPEVVTASVTGDEVTIDVNMYEAQADASIIGVEFKVIYPGVLMVESVVEGEFFKSFGETIFQYFDDLPDAVIAFEMLIPTGPGEYPDFPEGGGTLATITFKVKVVPPQVTTYPLTLKDVIIVDKDANVLPYHHLEDGALIVPAKPEDLNDDGKVDILDMAVFALAFGSKDGTPRWNQKADINRDGKVNILDGVLIAKSFGFVA